MPERYAIYIYIVIYRHNFIFSELYISAILSVLLGDLHNRLTPEKFNINLAVTKISPDLTVGQGFLMEVILTFVLVYVIFGTTDPNRSSLGSPSILIGLTVTLLHLSAVS